MTASSGQSALDLTVSEADVIVCCGPGGVGKTTASAAIGLHAARLGRRVVVITIDPARRLADALGVPGSLGNDPVRLDLDSPAETPGELWALMLDASTTFDGLVRRYAASPAQAERILDNGFYRNVASTLSGTQDYMAAERLHALHSDSRFDLVVVDTPPTRNALDFLAAPGTLKRFIDHPLFKLLTLPTRRGLRMLNVATQPVLRTIGKAVGGEVLADAVAFFQSFQGMESGFRSRADEVNRLVMSPRTRFVLVTAPRDDTVAEAAYFVGRLTETSLRVDATVVNRATPTFGDPPDRVPRGAAGRAAYDNLCRLNDIAVDEQALLDQALPALAPAAVWVPLLDADVHDRAALDEIAHHLFAGV